jgi:hypothetical protein
VGYVIISGGVGGSSLDIPDLRCEMDLRFGSSMTFGVGIGPVRMLFQIYLVLCAQKMHMLWLFWRFWWI